ncbi:MAG: efflux RND transporter permease subunit [Fimbriimonadaceae bacterium]
MGLTKIAILRPVLVWMGVAVIVLAGILSYVAMRKEQNPDVQFGVVTVSTIYPGAGAEEINNLVTRPLEEAVSGVTGLQEVTGSSQEGVSTVVMQFELGTDMDAALNEVRSRVDQSVGALPREIEKPVVSKADTSSDPVMTIALKSKSLSNREIRELADRKLRDLFARLPGVSSVEVSGGEQREIQVRLKKDALLLAGIGITEVQQALQAAAINVPSGRITQRDREFSVRVEGEFASVEEIGDVYVKVPDPDGRGSGQPVRLGDIASIVDTNSERRTFTRLDGIESVTLSVQKAKEGNAVEIETGVLHTPVAGAKSLLALLERDYGIESVVTSNAAEDISESLFDLQFALGFGIVLVGAVVWLFLHNFRGTLIVALAIPVCLMGALLLLRVFGQTVNNLSMLSLSLAIGVLVDDAIVVIENIYRHLTMGEEPVEAAINGRSEIGLAAIAITLADVVVFVPVAFMGGIVGQFFRPLGIGYACAVIISLLVSFTLTPMLASRWYRKGEDWEHPKGRFARWFENGFQSFANRYKAFLAVTLRHRWHAFGAGWVALVSLFMFIGGSFAQDPIGAATGTIGPVVLVLVIGALVFVGNWLSQSFKPHLLVFACLYSTAFPIGAVMGQQYAAWKKEDVFKFAFFPPSDSGEVQITVDLPPGSSLERTSAIVAGLEDQAMAHPESEYVVARIGSRSSGFSSAERGANYAVINVTLRDKMALLDQINPAEDNTELRTVSDVQVAAEMLEAIGKVAGARVTVAAGGSFGFGAPIQMSFRSDDRQKLAATVKRVSEGLASGAVPGVINVDTSSKPGAPEFRAVPDRAVQGDMDVSTATIGAALRVLYEGDTQTKFRVRGEEFDVRVLMDDVDRSSPEVLSGVPIAYRQGDPVFLSDVARVETSQTVDKIERRDRQEEIRVTADLVPGEAAGSVQAKIDSWIKENDLVEEGVDTRPLGQADFQARESGFLMSALLLGLVLVYMILAALYNNYLFPLIIQLAQPQAMIGALLALILTDKTLNIVGFIGIIAMVGLVGKNAILLVDYTNTLRARGVDRFEALCEAGRARIRPIMMTTIALVAGLLPVALAIGRGSEFRETIGITIIGGTVLSTLLTLLVIPCSYSIFDDLSQAFEKMRAILASMRKRAVN